MLRAYLDTRWPTLSHLIPKEHCLRLITHTLTSKPLIIAMCPQLSFPHEKTVTSTTIVCRCKSQLTVCVWLDRGLQKLVSSQSELTMPRNSVLTYYSHFRELQSRFQPYRITNSAPTSLSTAAMCHWDVQIFAVCGHEFHEVVKKCEPNKNGTCSFKTEHTRRGRNCFSCEDGRPPHKIPTLDECVAISGAMYETERAEKEKDKKAEEARAGAAAGYKAFVELRDEAKMWREEKGKWFTDP